MAKKKENCITSRPEAEAALAALNKIDETLAAWDLEEASEISRIKEAHRILQTKAGRPALEQEKKLLSKSLEAWARDDVKTWPKKSIETSCGSCGFRTGNPAVVLIKKVAKNFDAALDLLQKNLKAFVRQVPQIDKEKILALARDDKKWPEYEGGLALCGLKVEKKEEFWIETGASKALDDAAEKLKAA